MKCLKAAKDQYLAIGVSTDHLSKADKAQFTLWSQDESMNALSERGTGYYLKLYDRDYLVPVQGLDSLSVGVQRIIMDAWCSGFRLIEFDVDANHYEGYATFDDEPV
ncbi:hypothetical protein ACP3V3_01840 [Vibrio sp. PNB22_3_1]